MWSEEMIEAANGNCKASRLSHKDISHLVDLGFDEEFAVKHVVKYEDS